MVVVVVFAPLSQIRKYFLNIIMVVVVVSVRVVVEVVEEVVRVSVVVVDVVVVHSKYSSHCLLLEITKQM